MSPPLKYELCTVVSLQRVHSEKEEKGKFMVEKANKHYLSHMSHFISTETSWWKRKFLL